MKRIIAVLACLLLMLPLFLFQFDAEAITLQTKPPMSLQTIPPVSMRTIPPVLKTRPPLVTKPPFLETKPPRTKPPEPTPIPTKPPKTKPPKTKPPQTTVKPSAGQNICSMGLYFREMRPILTDEWYLFTPIELGFEGEQIYPLIASNAYEVGELKLTIENGQLLVKYSVLDGIKIKDEFLTFFPNLDSVKTVNVKMLQGQEFKFNEPIDIAAVFGEDAKVILYMNNAASFNNTVPGLKHFVVEDYRPWMYEIMNLLD
jgi:hypothetical protein